MSFANIQRCKDIACAQAIKPSLCNHSTSTAPVASASRLHAQGRLLPNGSGARTTIRSRAWHIYRLTRRESLWRRLGNLR